MITLFDNEGDLFRAYIIKNPDAAIILRGADGSATVATGDDIPTPVVVEEE